MKSLIKTILKILLFTILFLSIKQLSAQMPKHRRYVLNDNLSDPMGNVTQNCRAYSLNNERQADTATASAGNYVATRTGLNYGSNTGIYYKCFNKNGVAPGLKIHVVAGSHITIISNAGVSMH